MDMLNLVSRLLLCSISYNLLYDFFFSLHWMHGYVWALHQNLEIKEIRDKVGDSLGEYLEMLFPFYRRSIASILYPLFVMMTLK